MYRGSVALTSGRFAVVADEGQFTLVPWCQILERFRGREVEAKPCLGDCGRLTTAHETIAGGYCVHCAADTGGTPIG
jgi:uncharacterized protein DUF3363